MNNNIITKVLYKIDNNYGTVSLELKIVFCRVFQIEELHICLELQNKPLRIILRTYMKKPVFPVEKNLGICF